jgi:hypothetical protein
VKRNSGGKRNHHLVKLRNLNSESPAPKETFCLSESVLYAIEKSNFIIPILDTIWSHRSGPEIPHANKDPYK